MIFLVTYDTKQGKLLEEPREFPDDARGEAMLALRNAQEANLDDLEHVEIALFEAASRATLEGTHSRYFRTLAELGEIVKHSSRPTA
jgi:hypothetical protein